jgi:hypothetical protein
LDLFDREDYARVWKTYDKYEKRFRGLKAKLPKRYSDQFGGESLKQFVPAFMGEEPPAPAVLIPSTIVPEGSGGKNAVYQELAQRNPR